MKQVRSQPEGAQICLPTCCVCQKIRDAQGKWHERSEYRADYQGVLFTHTYCQGCAIRLYPEFCGSRQLEAGAPGKLAAEPWR